MTREMAQEVCWEIVLKHSPHQTFGKQQTSGDRMRMV